jgi:hypothetical protein
MKRLRATALAVIAWLSIGNSHGQTCAGFTDVGANSPFCPAVEWLRNRGVTLGCTATAYCPDQSVLRSQMAAFMNRLGTALTPRQLWVESNWGAVDLGTTPVICQTSDYHVVGYPRRAFVDLVFAAFAGASIDVSVDLALSTNGGGTWTRMTAIGSRGSVAANQWGTVANLANADLAVGQKVRFGVMVGRVTGTGNLDQSRCNLRVSIESRDGASSPY